MFQKDATAWRANGTPVSVENVRYGDRLVGLRGGRMVIAAVEEVSSGPGEVLHVIVTTSGRTIRTGGGVRLARMAGSSIVYTPVRRLHPAHRMVCYDNGCPVIDPVLATVEEGETVESLFQIRSDDAVFVEGFACRS